MKKVAVVLYPGYCLFEITVLLEALAQRQCKVAFFSEHDRHCRSEEGILLKADALIDSLNPEDFDALALSGFASDGYPLDDDRILLDIIRAFHNDHKLIGAISIAPFFLVKAGIMKERQFMCGLLKEDLKEEEYSEDDLTGMLDWAYCVAHYDSLKYLLSDNVLTSVSFGFREWAMAFCHELGIESYPKSFGLVDSDKI